MWTALLMDACKCRALTELSGAVCAECSSAGVDQDSAGQGQGLWLAVDEERLGSRLGDSAGSSAASGLPLC